MKETKEKKMQPLAAVARCGGGGGLVVTLTFLLLAVSRSAVAFCPVGCLCDDDKLQVTCDDVNLEVIPITLNPSVEVRLFFFSFFIFELVIHSNGEISIVA